MDDVEKRIKKERRIFFIVVPVILLIVLVGISFAFFNYTRTGTSNTIRVGRISFVTRQTETINLTNVFPIDRANVDTDTDNVDSIVIEIEGDTDYEDGIEYLVSSKDANIYTSTGKQVPVSLDIEVDDLGTENNNYFTARDNTNESIYKRLVGDELVGETSLLAAKTYLDSGEKYYWTLSPFTLHSSFTDAFAVGHGSIVTAYMYESLGLRPAISLKHGTPVVGGTGTVADPYVIE